MIQLLARARNPSSRKHARMSSSRRSASIARGVSSTNHNEPPNEPPNLFNEEDYETLGFSRYLGETFT